jgi:hypothetical protein
VQVPVGQYNDYYGSSVVAGPSFQTLPAAPGGMSEIVSFNRGYSY